MDGDLSRAERQMNAAFARFMEVRSGAKDRQQEAFAAYGEALVSGGDGDAKRIRI